ncbi:MAG: DNA cytosine methyltransferase [Clostridiales bacterium]|nr:DNA cytosine methyltransferase [Clostridiales bacterium]
MMTSFTFIDLFSGIGGFHQAMTRLGGKCVLASEIDPNCIKVYADNYGIDSNVNIRDIEIDDIPAHDVLCAGFPCQAFSKAGKQEGLNDLTRGTLFFEIERILRAHKTKYILLENVRNLVSHDNGNTWKVIQAVLRDIGYRLTKKPLILSPHQFGIPQIRERVIIPGVYDPENVDVPLHFDFGKLLHKNENDIYTVVDPNDPADEYVITDYERMVLEAWDEFYQGITLKVIGFPVWSEWFNTKEIPDDFPNWKKEFVAKNQQLYLNNKPFIDFWLKKHNYLEAFSPTHTKFEWQCGTNTSSIMESLIQFRPSGVRVKTPTCFPALVAIVQTPVIGKYQRRITVREAARLQSFPDTFRPDANRQEAFKQFGNSVNVDVIHAVADQLFNQIDASMVDYQFRFVLNSAAREALERRTSFRID